MKKFFSLIIFMVLVFFGTIYSQGWTNLGNFPDSLFKGNSGGHGIAVDPDGKIWFGFYGTTDSVFDAFTATWKPVRVIHVFNADGTPASFSPIKTITVGGVTDTLFNSFRGMRADNNGNILYSSFDVLYRINYQTGEGMAKVQPVAGMTLTAAAVDLAGNVFVGPVIPGNPVKVYTSDFTFLGNVVDASVGFSRTLEVSDDGNTVYWAGYTNNQVHIYNRPDEFSPFELKDSILFGFQCESITWQPDRQLLWAASGSGLTPPNADTAHVTSWTFPTWYAWDPASNTIVDSMKWVIHSGTDLANQRPRGLDFSPDGQYAYVTCFGATSLPAIQKFQKPSSTIFTEDFESGTADAGWFPFYAGEENITSKPMTDAPQALTGGGNYLAWVQDVNASYTGSSVVINGASNLANYSIEADVYCYVNHPQGSAYTGLVVYANPDTAGGKRDFYKLRADFDASNRINFSGLKSDPNTFLPLFSKDFKGVDNPGIFPTADGWHKMKIEVFATSPNETSFWCYFDGTLLAGCPIADTTSTRNTSGSFGLYTFQMDADGIAGYFDNIVVKQFQSPTSVEDYDAPEIPENMYLSQNYPNPFNPTTNIIYNLKEAQDVQLVIYDILGEKVKTLVSQYQSPGQYTISWNGQNDLGNKVKSGIYIYSLKAGDVFVSKKMLMVK